MKLSIAMARGTVSRFWRGAMLLACTVLAMAAPAGAQISGNLRYVSGYDFIPSPPSSEGPTTFVLHGVFPTGCGLVEEATVIDPEHVTLRVRSTTPCDSVPGSWTQPFPLGVLAAGIHTVEITLTVDRPDSGALVYQGAVTFGVGDTTVVPPPPPPPPPVLPLLTMTATDPWPPTPDVPMALIVGGYAPFDCPRVVSAAVIDTSHLALTLASETPCSDTTRFWSHRFEFGVQREGHHFMDLAITLAGDPAVTHHVPVHFLVVHDTTGWGPPPEDSLESVLSKSRPNPFKDVSRFSVSLEVDTDADVAVFDILGRRVSTVFRGRVAAGTTELAWNGRRSDGSRAPAGLYFYRLTMPGRILSRRLVLLRQ